MINFTRSHCAFRIDLLKRASDQFKGWNIGSVRGNRDRGNVGLYADFNPVVVDYFPVVG